MAHVTDIELATNMCKTAIAEIKRRIGIDNYNKIEAILIRTYLHQQEVGYTIAKEQQNKPKEQYLKSGRKLSDLNEDDLYADYLSGMPKRELRSKYGIGYPRVTSIIESRQK